MVQSMQTLETTALVVVLQIQVFAILLKLNELGHMQSAIVGFQIKPGRQTQTLYSTAPVA
jgi:hypothetical protein